MKDTFDFEHYTNSRVAPLVGAWIERKNIAKFKLIDVVAPLVGAWIESLRMHHTMRSHCVAPLVGAWIESFYDLDKMRILTSLLL